MKYNKLKIGDLEVNIPIIQGGMGVGISMSGLAGEVSRCGGIGVISAAQPGFNEEDFYKDTFNANIRSLSYHIKKAKEISKGGVIGVNIMVAVTNYDEYVNCAIESGADIIFSGAGLPVELGKFSDKIKISPIISSAKAAKIILKRWSKLYNTTADIVVIEGPMAGGHLGFKEDEIFLKYDMTEEIKQIKEVVSEYEKMYNKKIPVVFGGGVFDKDDFIHYMSLGLDGVQIASRFVATKECDASEEFKKAYVECKKEDIVIVKSPVDLPARAIKNSFIKRLENGKEPIKKCFKCLNSCDINKIPYCISSALFNACKGNMEDALVFCGANTYKIDKITTVKEVIDSIIN